MPNRRTYPHPQRNPLTEANLRASDRRQFRRALVDMWPAWIALVLYAAFMIGVSYASRFVR